MGLANLADRSGSPPLNGVCGTVGQAIQLACELHWAIGSGQAAGGTPRDNESRTSAFRTPLCNGITAESSSMEGPRAGAGIERLSLSLFLFCFFRSEGFVGSGFQAGSH
eukprot:3388965-Amphidinium_carterae.1